MRSLRALGFVGTLFVLFVAIGCLGTTRSAAPNEDLGAIGDFTLTDQQGREVSRSDLLGKVWVASFIFTRCATLCPQVCASMAQLQEETDAETGVMFVSFSVDPDNDTPLVLKQYAARFGADSSRWIFLTGAREKIYELIQRGFLLGVQQNEGAARTPGNEVTHSSRLVLVDRRGHIHARDSFDGRKVDEEGKPVNDLPRLRQRLAELVREKP
jgi:cytochrome oxidase Cu insertion factor (SCO1/SenC/PrrC family)